MHYLLFIIGILLTAKTSFGQGHFDKQEYARMESLPDDTAKVNLLIVYAEKIQYAAPLKSGEVINTAMSISQKLNYQNGLARCYELYSTMYFYAMQLDSCNTMLDVAFGLIAGKNDPESKKIKASLFQRKGAVKHQQQDMDSAIHYYLLSANIYSETGLPERAIISFYNISGIYRYLNDTSQALYYARQTRAIAVSANDSVYLLRSLIVLGDAFVLSEKYDSVLWVANSGLQMEHRLKMPFAYGKFHDLLGQYFSNYTTKYDSAIHHFQIALDTITFFDIPFDQALVLLHLGEVYLKKGDNSSSIRYSKKASELARKLDMNHVLYYTLKNLSLAYEANGNYPESLKYLKEYLVVGDTLQNRNNRKLVMELEARYQAQKKEARLAMQLKTIQKKTFTNYFLAAVLVALGCISILIIILFRNNQKYQRRRINELETEKQLAATEAVLKGEEQERTRLAKDLHDGLGGMLAGIKYSFQTMKENLIMTPENQEAFERSMDMLDSSISEMRRVAHNMMPEALVKFGLDAALKDYCNDINKSGVLSVTYQSAGIENATINQTTSVALYRIVQELVSNTIRHSGATTALVQVIKSAAGIALTVEDNGKGFDTSVLQQTKGMGWSNIQSRVDFLKGKMDVQSSEKTGTSVLIELNA